MTTRTAKKTTSSASIAESSGNVFADLGLAHPEQELLKARLTLQILTALGHDIEIAVAPSRKKHGEMSVILG